MPDTKTRLEQVIARLQQAAEDFAAVAHREIDDPAYRDACAELEIAALRYAAHRADALLDRGGFPPPKH